LPVEAPPAPPYEEALPPDYQHNSRALMASSSLFQFAMSFGSSNTVLPAFLAALNSSDFLIGVSNGLGSGGWLLPQLLVASAAARMRRKKPLMMLTAWVGRPLFLLIALGIALTAVNNPPLARAIVMLGFFLFFVCDGIGSVPWFEILARTIPARRRGRVMGAGQAIGYLMGIGGGMVVSWALSERSPLAFPANYAFFYAAAGVILLGGAVALGQMHEPETPPIKQEAPSARAVLARMPAILAHDRPFALLIVVRILSGFVLMASAFYILHATKTLGLSLGVAGMFVSAQVAGSLAAGLLMGVIQDRWGPLAHIRRILLLSATSPIIALAMGPLRAALGPAVLYPYLALYFLLGVSMGSMGWPYFNWILEYADDASRPVYIGMVNTLGAAVMVAPMFGGWIAGVVSYQAVFALSLGFAIAGYALSLGLPNTRRLDRIRFRGLGSNESQNPIR